MSESDNERLDEDGGKVVWDADSFIAQIVDAEKAVTTEEAVIVMRSKDPHVIELVQRYYIVMRSTTSVFHPDPMTMRSLSEYGRKLTYDAAVRLAAWHLKRGEVIAPRWMMEFEIEARNAVRPRFPGVDDVRLTATLEPHFRARARRGEVEISIFTRELLRLFSLCICDFQFQLEGLHSQAASDVIDSDGFIGYVVERAQALADLVVPQIARTIVPYLIASTSHVDMTRLPVMEPRSMDALRLAMAISEIQTKLILVHEYGHLAFGHLELPPTTPEERIEREWAADRFALEALPHPDMDHEDPGDAFIAIRWLFQLQTLDELVGALLRDETPQLDDITSAQRMFRLSDEMPSGTLSIDAAATELTGAVWLTDMARRLLQRGPQWLRALASNLSRQSPDGRVEPWWNDLSA